MNHISYLLLRLGLGLSLFGHGLVRLPKLDKFSAWMASSFEKSLLPQGLVMPYSYALPFAEFLIGLFLIIGLFTKQSLVASGILVLTLILGTTLIENWEALVSQLIHLALISVLINQLKSNYLAVDLLFRRKA